VSRRPLFFPGLHIPSHADRFERCMVSVARLRPRRADFHPRDWIMDSGAFSEVSVHGRYTASPAEYAEQVSRWSRCGNLLTAVAQDYMCEPHVQVKAWGPHKARPRPGFNSSSEAVAYNIALSAHRYILLREAFAFKPPVHIMPVLQGWVPQDYVYSLSQYGRHVLPHGAWVGVGSVCRRNGRVAEVEAILAAIYRVRPDLRLHGFGLKLTALRSGVVARLLYSCDSMAWSHQARNEGRDPNDWREAAAYVQRVAAISSGAPVFQASVFDPSSPAAGGAAGAPVLP
jgi:hypothetical protein